MPPHQPDREASRDVDCLVTVRDWLRYAVSRFNGAGLSFGHGMQDAYDEAAYLILHTLHLSTDRLEPFLDARLLQAERHALRAVIARRVDERLPAAYITREAWLGDFRFYVDERVIVPRSFLAELIEDGCRPWIAEPESVGNALDLCTGSGCLAILMAHAFPAARIDAADLSDDALAVAHRNVTDHGLADRVRLVRADLFAGLGGRRYDLIVSNPPYVTAASMATLPMEYRHEPEMALAAGEDGLDVIRRILASAASHLKPNGILAVEAGHNLAIVEEAFPQLDFTWAGVPSGEDMIFILDREQLAAYAGR
jgi:ribosomal protein L3 glutamine methyltransferase